MNKSNDEKKDIKTKPQLIWSIIAVISGWIMGIIIFYYSGFFINSIDTSISFKDNIFIYLLAPIGFLLIIVTTFGIEYRFNHVKNRAILLSIISPILLIIFSFIYAILSVNIMR